MNFGIIVPSNNPTAFMSEFLPSCRWLLEMRKEDFDQVSILLCAQEPWTREQIQEVYMNPMGLKLLNIRLPAESPPRMCYFRQQAAMLAPNVDVYMLADDNLKFSAEAPNVFEDVREYFLNYPECGIIQCHRKTHKTCGRCITATDNGLITTNKGLFLRNVRPGKGLWEPDTMGLLASLEETIAGYRVLEEGYFPARYYGCTFEHEIHKIGADNGIHSRELISEYGERYVRERYHDKSWFHESNRLPKDLMEKMAREKLLHFEAVSRLTWLIV